MSTAFTEACIHSLPHDMRAGKVSAVTGNSSPNDTPSDTGESENVPLNSLWKFEYKLDAS
jgi:hypothetical protein